jgi:hypothetical protein
MIQAQPDTKRKQEMLDMYQQGFTLEEIGKKFHVTRERARQIIETKWLDEIEDHIARGFSVDIGAYLATQKKLHSSERKRRMYSELLAKKDELPQLIEKYTSASAFYKDYKVTSGVMRDMFPEAYEKLSLMEQVSKNRWNKNYIKCRQCETTTDAHFKEGYCKKCFRDAKEFGGNREKAMERAGRKCESCGISRAEYKKIKNQDLYVVHLEDKKNHDLNNLKVLCYTCMVALFKPQEANRLGPDRWSRKYTKCRKCGTRSISHYGHGFCKKCYFQKR